MAKSENAKKHLVLKTILGIFCAVIIVLLVYVAYVFLSYSRIEDNIKLDVSHAAESTRAKAGDEFSIVTYNVGLGIYSADFGFFMDGGTESRATSKDEVLKNVAGQTAVLKSLNPDFIALEETAIDCTCNYGVNMYESFTSSFNTYDAVAAECWNSPYLFYPVTKPFGKAKSCLTTLSRYTVDSAIRHSLPVEEGVTKIIDLDRCFSKSSFVLDNDGTLAIFVIHPSAYTSDGTIADEQIKVLMEAAEAEYKAGHYVVIAGDWNKDIEGDSDQYFGVSSEGYTWAQNLNLETLSSGFSVVSSLDKENPVATCRNADGPYDPATQLRIIIDGFIVSDNVEVTSAKAIDTGFAYSDHNPVYMTFKLKTA